MCGFSVLSNFEIKEFGNCLFQICVATPNRFLSLLEEGASGVLSFRTILFTLGWITLALLSVWQRLKLKKRPTKSNLNKTLLKSTPFIFAFTFWIIATGITARIDFTPNARYTLTSVTKNICNYITEPITVTLLMGGDLPLEFYKLKQEALLTLQNFKTESKHIVVLQWHQYQVQK